MSNWEPKRGDEVYDEHGQAGYYIDRAKGGGHIVQAIVDDGGDGFSEPSGSYVGDPVRWQTVFSKPPEYKLEARIAELDAQRIRLIHEIEIARQQQRQMEADQRAMKERLGLHEQLTWIDDLLAGRFTHYLVKESDYGENWTVMTAEDFRKNRNLSQVRLQLWVSTHERSEHFQWRVIQGSSGERFDDKSKGVTPFKSEAEAIAKRNELLLAHITDMASGKKSTNASILRGWVTRAQGFGLEVPGAALAELAAQELHDANAEFDKQKAAFEAAANRVLALKGGAA
jgi:hypothetical protein